MDVITSMLEFKLIHDSEIFPTLPTPTPTPIPRAFQVSFVQQL